MVRWVCLQAEGTSAESVAALAKIDRVKQRMEATYETLQVTSASIWQHISPTV